MPYIRIEKNGLQYEAEYFREDNSVIIIGERGQSVVDVNGMTEESAAQSALRNLIREKQINPQLEGQ
ncbi:hypothetical protein [Xenorhabdus bovienii]|uniref:hypothetical protein n=1 Tax=Xenorhabdus bovienii TaxID=40576 RepID=UPI0023B31C05|nr:hypothetical protein [Xenorhabdus bovienii]MDE9434214.1 hypothetical protein [Xenorhabdus bovienii]MDE9491840.1 hypothetical protein [Xenorhabdus bovienii]MDE9508221.1 hypothetical protein [Xenorhabdus bovienii]MDE9549211.1 hypothetical protein [Xenorhabdus bovienii]